ncbi:hypothetical protein HDU97_002513 [Phlyctochytrium planicorne]|nr:hypothetical protein HDU97_002513 [Phlyctochytrium planicorne]
MVIAAKIASGLWPPPDSVASLKYEASQVLVGVRHFVSSAQELNLQLSEPTQETSLEFEILGSDLSSGEFISRIDEGSDKVIQSVARLVAIVTMERRASGVLVEHARTTVTCIGQLMSLVEDIQVNDLSNVNKALGQLIDDFLKAKEASYDVVNDLITFTRSAMDSFAPPKALSKVLDCTSSVLRAMDDLVMATKLLVDSHDYAEQQSLLSEAERLQKSSSKRESDLVMLQRRAMSLTFLPNGDRRPSISSVGDALAAEATDVFAEGVSSARYLSGSGKTQSNPNLMSPIMSHRRPSAGNVLEGLTQSIRRGSTSSPTQPNLDDLRSPPGRIPGPGTRSSGLSDYSLHSKTPDTLPSASIWADDFGSPSMEPPQPPRRQNDKLAKFFGERPKEESFNSDRRLWFLNADYTPDSISFNKDGRVNGGTFDALVQRLTLHDQPADRMVARYLITPPPNINSDDLKIWQEKKQNPIRLRVYNTLKLWLDNYWDEQSDSYVLEKLLQFAKGPITENQNAIAGRLVHLIQSKYSSLQVGAKGSTTSQPPRRINSDEPPAPIIPRVSMKKLTIVDIDPLEIARQITLIQSRMFIAIHPLELINLEWSRKDSRSVNVRAMTDMSNKLTGWVVDSILSEYDAKKRALVLKQFIKIGDRAVILKNYDLAVALVSALHSSSISRLAKTWGHLTTKTNDTLRNLQTITDSSRNHSNYRSEIKNLNPPCIPFLGLYLTDLTFTSDGNPDIRNEKLINFDKFAKAHKIITDLQRFQMPYALQEVSDLSDWIFSSIRASSIKNAHDLYDLSLQLEPRGAKEPDEAIVFKEMEDKLRLLEEAGLL